MNQSLPQLQLANGASPLKVDLLHSKKSRNDIARFKS